MGHRISRKASATPRRCAFRPVFRRSKICHSITVSHMDFKSVCKRDAHVPRSCPVDRGRSYGSRNATRVARSGPSLDARLPPSCCPGHVVTDVTAHGSSDKRRSARRTCALYLVDPRSTRGTGRPTREVPRPWSVVHSSRLRIPYVTALRQLPRPKLTPRTLRVSREGAPRPRGCTAYACVFSLVSFGCSDQIPIFGPIRRQ